MENSPVVVDKTKIAYSVALALFCVVFLWGFWSRGPFALGINAFVFFLGIIIFFVEILRRGERYQSRDLVWILPFVLMALSFAIYENPFFKICTLFVFPIAFAFFYNYAFISEKAQKVWNISFYASVVERMGSFVLFIGQSVSSLFSIFTFRSDTRGATLKRIGVGVLILIVALLVILPLLSSADSAFADKLGSISDLLKNIFSSSLVGRLSVFLILAIGILSAVLGWGRSNELAESTEEKIIDALIAGIVLVGVLVFYALFIWVQLDRLWVGTLPFAFAETESLVKSGFWQLLFLSVLNLGIFFVLYRKTTPLIKKILSVFTIASFLLLISAGHRMILYVTNYGFSYEKFYALYAVLFCAILFLWLFSRLFVAARSNVLKFVAFQFLWMFALVSIFPVEQFIVRTNVSLVSRSDSRIKLFEMKMLSPDVLGVVSQYNRQGMFSHETFDWNPWIEEQKMKIVDKKWYEFTVSNF